MGCGTIVFGYFQVAFWSVACECQTRRIRETVLRSILNKEITYFDVNKTGQLSTRLTEDVNKIHDGIGDKIGSALQFFAGFISGLVLGYIDSIDFTEFDFFSDFRLVKGWKLTLVILSVSPLLFFSAVIATKVNIEKETGFI